MFFGEEVEYRVYCNCGNLIYKGDKKYYGAKEEGDNYDTGYCCNACAKGKE